jgi:hypothetical protein
MLRIGIAVPDVGTWLDAFGTEISPSGHVRDQESVAADAKGAPRAGLSQRLRGIGTAEHRALLRFSENKVPWSSI